MNLHISMKRKFTPDEDNLLKRIVMIYGPHRWKFIAEMIPNRTARQCRDRYINYLQPSIRHGQWTEEEDQLLTKKVKEHGTKWSFIKKFFVGRSTSALKNRFYVQLGGWKQKKENGSDQIEKEVEKEEHKECNEEDGKESVSQINCIEASIFNDDQPQFFEMIW